MQTDNDRVQAAKADQSVAVVAEWLVLTCSTPAQGDAIFVGDSAPTWPGDPDLASQIQRSVGADLQGDRFVGNLIREVAEPLVPQCSSRTGTHGRGHLLGGGSFKVDPRPGPDIEGDREHAQTAPNMDTATGVPQHPDPSTLIGPGRPLRPRRASLRRVLRGPRRFSAMPVVSPPITPVHHAKPQKARRPRREWDLPAAGSSGPWQPRRPGGRDTGGPRPDHEAMLASPATTRTPKPSKRGPDPVPAQRACLRSLSLYSWPIQQRGDSTALSGVRRIAAVTCERPRSCRPRPSASWPRRSGGAAPSPGAGSGRCSRSGSAPGSPGAPARPPRTDRPG